MNNAQINHEHFYQYTSGRWFRDEAAQLKARYLEFDVEALKAVAINAVDGASSVQHMVKLPEGAYNKAILITLNNQKEVVARLPTPRAGPPHYTTASEVATMEYCRSYVSLPVPRVLAWCSRKEETPVHAEYIIMEKAPGVELFRIWPDLHQEHRYKLADELVKLQAKMVERVLPAYGSIFFREDLQNELFYEIDDKFVVGPSLESYVWDAERRDMEIDRGPWKSPEAYLRAISQREKKWVTAHASPQNLSGRQPLGMVRDPAAHINLLNHFEAVIPYIIPPSDSKLTHPTLWHNDLGTGNIFISEDEFSHGRISITSIIDWQSNWIGPMYLHCRVPRLFRYHSPWKHPGFKMVGLPDNFAQMNEEEQIEAQKDVDLVNQEKMWLAVMARRVPGFEDMVTASSNDLFASLARYASSPWGSLFMGLYQSLIRLEACWPTLPSSTSPCPISFSQEERKQFFAYAEEWQGLQDKLRMLDDYIGVNDEGWVAVEDFDAVLEQYEAARELWFSGEYHKESEWLYSDPVTTTHDPYAYL